jgi:hypothetical protein
MYRDCLELDDFQIEHEDKWYSIEGYVLVEDDEVIEVVFKKVFIATEDGDWKEITNLPQGLTKEVADSVGIKYLYLC